VGGAWTISLLLLRGMATVNLTLLAAVGGGGKEIEEALEVEAEAEDAEVETETEAVAAIEEDALGWALKAGPGVVVGDGGGTLFGIPSNGGRTRSFLLGECFWAGKREAVAIGDGGTIPWP